MVKPMPKVLRQQKGSIMGIKNIHIVFICASILISVVFGFWGLKNDYHALGYVSLVLAIGLIVYGVSFFKKIRAL